MSQLVGAFILAALFVSPAQPRKLNQVQLQAALSCVQKYGPDLGAPLPRFSGKTLRIRYHVGPFSISFPSGQSVQADKDNEVRIAVYGSGEDSVIVYDLFLEENNGSIEVTLGSPATFSRKAGVWLAGDNPGGTATQFYMEGLLKELSFQPPVLLPQESFLELPRNGYCRSR